MHNRERLSTRPDTSAPDAARAPTRIIVHGAAGRVGARLCDLSQRDPEFVLAAALERAGHPAIGRPSSPDAPGRESVKVSENTGVSAHAVIDFSSDAGARRALEIARAAGAALLVGTTALTPETVALLRAAGAERPVIVAPNTSLGVAVLAAIAAHAAAALGAYEVSLVEAHHSAKKDAPSGTALRLAEAVRSAGGAVRDDQILAIRGGDVVGEHTLRFAGPGEYVELTHRATSRDVFARGALRAARWLHGRAPGWYTMNDVLALGAR